jgi:hypothetical protein
MGLLGNPAVNSKGLSGGCSTSAVDVALRQLFGAANSAELLLLTCAVHLLLLLLLLLLQALARPPCPLTPSAP